MRTFVAYYKTINGILSEDILKSFNENNIENNGMYALKSTKYSDALREAHEHSILNFSEIYLDSIYVFDEHECFLNGCQIFKARNPEITSWLRDLDNLYNN